MFSSCAGYCVARLCCFFFFVVQIQKPPSFFFFFLAGSYQLQVKSLALDRLKESESTSSVKAYYHSMQFFQSCDSST